MILSCLGVLVSDRQTDERTLVVVESLSRLKTERDRDKDRDRDRDRDKDKDIGSNLLIQDKLSGSHSESDLDSIPNSCDVFTYMTNIQSSLINLINLHK